MVDHARLRIPEITLDAHNNVVIRSVSLHEPTPGGCLPQDHGQKDQRWRRGREVRWQWPREPRCGVDDHEAGPFFFLAFLGIGFGSGTSMAGIPQGVGYVSFLTPGIIGMTLLFSTTAAGLTVHWDREFGFLKEILY
jgi:hypothetical protein